MNAAGTSPILVIGAARSGTKLLRDLLARHPELSKVPYDVNYIWRIGNEKLPHDELPESAARPDVISRIRTLMPESADGPGTFVEKTVSNCLRLPFVRKVYPEARLIHLFRDGHDVIASAFQEWSRKPSWRYVLEKAIHFPIRSAPGYAFRYARGLMSGPGARATWGPRYDGIDRDVAELDTMTVCARQWRRCVEMQSAAMTDVPDAQQITIHYEDLATQPAAVLARIAAFLNLDPAPLQAAAPSVVRTDRIGQYRRGLSDDQIATIDREVEDARITQRS